MPRAGEEQVLRDLRRIPGVGRETARDLYRLGMRSIADLKGRDPEEMYREHCRQKGFLVDRCVLYVFRSAAYFASAEHDPRLLKWWNWKDGGLAFSSGGPRTGTSLSREKPLRGDSDD